MPFSQWALFSVDHFSLLVLIIAFINCSLYVIMHNEATICQAFFKKWFVYM